MEHDVPRRRRRRRQEEVMDLPPGFRFHPTDEELVTHYLAPKTADPAGFTAHAVGEADLNKVEPWDLPSRATMGEKEWYFFVVKDRKYPTGTRTNRATESGYWKATGKDREIFSGGAALVGMKKTLVFYTGRAPRGGKTGWVMHEYRLDGGGRHAATAGAGAYSLPRAATAGAGAYSLPRAATSRDEWVLCRVFKKSLETTTVVATGSSSKRPGACTGMTAAGCSMLSTAAADDIGLAPCPLPPLIDVAGGGNTSHPAATTTTPPHVTCFSNALESQFLNPPFLLPSTPTTAAMTAAQQGASDHHHHLTMDDDSASAFFTSSMHMQYAQEVVVAGGPPGSMVHELLNGGGGGWYSKGERERLSGASQDTGVTSEQVNPTEISSSQQQQHMDHHEASFWSY